MSEETTSKLEPSVIALKALLMEQPVYLWGKDKNPLYLGEDEEGKTCIAIACKVSVNGGELEERFLREYLDFATFVRLAEKLPPDYLAELAGDVSLNKIKKSKAKARDS